mgnify:CR=1 FL=1
MKSILLVEDDKSLNQGIALKLKKKDTAFLLSSPWGRQKNFLTLRHGTLSSATWACRTAAAWISAGRCARSAMCSSCS